MLNGRLAKHYGIPGVDGWEFRKVPLPAGQPSRRRADDGQRAEGDGQRHQHLAGHPRGLGAGAHPGHAAAAAARRSRRRRAGHPRGHHDPRAARQASQMCRLCEPATRKIDPPGFALESFDVIGGWRDYYRTTGNGKAVIIDGRRMPYLQGPEGGPRRRDAGRPDVSRTSTSSSNCCLKDKDQLARA